MKRVNFLMIFFFSFIAFSLEKSGIKEYDNLDFSRGEIIAYYDKDSNYTENEELAMFYRKVFSESKGIYIVSDFYKQTDTPQLIFEMTDLSDDDTKMGKEASYDVFGTLLYVADLKTGMFNGKYTSYKNGKIDYIADYLQNELTGLYIKYLDNKKVYQSEYKTGVLDGETIIYNSDRSESIRKSFKNGRLINIAIKNYRLQKIGIPKYDNLDFLKGEIITYYNENGDFVSQDSEEAVQYRKSFGKNLDTGLFLVADFYINTNNVQSILETEKPYLFKGLSGGKNFVQFYENGNIWINQVLNEDERRIEAKNYDYFGNLKSISTYENKKLVNIRYIEE